jgi:hypothetical protein
MITKLHASRSTRNALTIYLKVLCLGNNKNITLRAPLVHPTNWAGKLFYNFLLKWNQNLRILSLEAYPNIHKNYTKQSKIGPIENKLKDKNYRSYGKSCLRMENHANSTGNVLCHLHDFLFLGMICCGLYNFCLLGCFLWGLFWLSNFKIWIFLSKFNY